MNVQEVADSVPSAVSVIPTHGPQRATSKRIQDTAVGAPVRKDGGRQLNGAHQDSGVSFLNEQNFVFKWLVYNIRSTFSSSVGVP